jgi:hypothetical protein
MARVLESYEWKRKGAGIYPWAEWTDGEIWLIEQGKDFKVRVETMVSMLRTRAATVERCKVRVSQDKREGTIVFQFWAVPPR